MKAKLVILLFACWLASSCGRSNEVSPHLTAILEADTTSNKWDVPGDTPPDGGCVPLRIRLSQPLGKLFNDLNAAHLVQARKGGIRPVRHSEEVWEQGEGLVQVSSNSYYYVDELNHSYPYLKPHAADLLMEIGRRFNEALAARGGGAYRIKVTSILRTPLSVGRLRRVNRNATGESAHQYATTFDISYSKFICDDASATHRTFEDLKNLLAEVLVGLRDEGRCLVKHEQRQSCFHITATVPTLNMPYNETDSL